MWKENFKSVLALTITALCCSTIIYLVIRLVG